MRPELETTQHEGQWVYRLHCTIELATSTRGPFRLGPQVIQLRPTPYCRTPILSYSLDVTPADHILHWQFDALGNQLARIIFPTKTAEFAIEVDLIADLTPINPFAFFLEPGFETYPSSIRRI